ncbi:MAG: hypothetical protein ABI658_29965 [Acidimicrobiales bacterium]
MRIDPVPSDEEAAAVVAAIEVLWPRPGSAATNARIVSPAWRFSGRWWSGTSVVRQSRP